MAGYIAFCAFILLWWWFWQMHWLMHLVTPWKIEFRSCRAYRWGSTEVKKRNIHSWPWKQKTKMTLQIIMCMELTIRMQMAGYFNDTPWYSSPTWRTSHVRTWQKAWNWKLKEVDLFCFPFSFLCVNQRWWIHYFIIILQGKFKGNHFVFFFYGEILPILWSGVTKGWPQLLFSVSKESSASYGYIVSLWRLRVSDT